MTWRHISTSAMSGGGAVTVYISEDKDEVLYKAELSECTPDYAPSAIEAKQRLADKLELIVRGLRR